MGVNGKDESKLVAQLQQENRKLRSELEEQYKQAIKLADTIQMVHLARMKEAAKDMHHKITPASPPEDFKKDLDGTSAGMEGQQQDILNSKQPFAAQAEQLRTLEDRARKWAKKYLHKIKAAASKAEAAAGIPSPAPASGAGENTSSPAGSQTGPQRTGRPQSGSVAASALLPTSERTPTKPLRNGESESIRRPAGRQPMSGRPVSRSVSRTPETTRGARSRLMDPIGGRTTGRASDPPRRSASRPVESSGRSVNSVTGAARRSMSRPAESTTRTVRTTDSVRRSISRPIEGSIRSQSRPADIRPARSVNRSTVDSRRSVSSRPADSTRSVSTVRSGPRPGSSTATSSWRAAPSDRSPAAGKAPQRASDTGAARNPSGESAARRTAPDPDPQPREPDLESTESLPDTSNRAAQEQRDVERREAERREAERREAEQLQAQRRELELRQAQQREDEQREAEQREAEKREAQRREVEQRQAEQRAQQQLIAQRQEAKLREAQREVAAMRAQPAESHMQYRNGATPPAAAPTSHVVPDISPPTNGSRGAESKSPSTVPNGPSAGRMRACVPAADGVAEALDKRANSDMRDSHPVTNIRTNQMYQSIDAPESVAEELLSATYASDTASMMSTMTGQEKGWAGAPAPKKKKTRTTFLNRLFSSKKA